MRCQGRECQGPRCPEMNAIHNGRLPVGWFLRHLNDIQHHPRMASMASCTMDCCVWFQGARDGKGGELRCQRCTKKVASLAASQQCDACHRATQCAPSLPDTSQLASHSCTPLSVMNMTPFAGRS